MALARQVPKVVPCPQCNFKFHLPTILRESVVSQTLEYVRESVRDNKSSLGKPELLSLKDFVNEKFENTENILLVNEAQNQSELENLKSKISGLEVLVVKFEQQKRRICDLCSISRTTPPHIIHNNPLMNNSGLAPCYSPAPEKNLAEMTEDEKIRPHIPVNRQTHPPTHLPRWRWS
ncbi:hypothetical protein VP01_1711g3 [Puccinia sorghi]|uniref:Uncharacterized protein n=1 Tax=Puccinia sorghi TaxID=27349 RepID=A0A0L6VHD5_9BASI|nr:hypothetical protein VP01_1711g3 [Puccinia sorghi]